MANHQWTYTELREAHERNMAGETFPEIAPDYGVSPRALRVAIRRHLGAVGPGSSSGRGGRPGEPWKDRFYREATALRSTTGLSWPAIAERLGWPGPVQSLTNGTLRYSRRAEIEIARDTSGLPLVVGSTIKPGVCRIAGCVRRVRSRGMCHACRQRAIRVGMLDAVAAPAASPWEIRKGEIPCAQE